MNLPTLGLVSFVSLAVLTGCTDKPIAKDPRLNEVGRFDLNWPLKASTHEAAVAEVEAKLGAGFKRAGGMVEWTAQTDATHCARIQLKDEGGKLSAVSEKLMKAHPDFATCISGT